MPDVPFQLLLATLSSFIISYVTIPVVIDVAIRKNLFNVSKFNGEVGQQAPGLGGIGIFIGVIISFTFFSSVEVFYAYKYLLTAYLILFFMGLKNDVDLISPRMKTVLLVLAAALLVAGDIRITALGAQVLPVWISYFFSLVFIVSLTNAFKLVDHTEGLAGGLGGIHCFTLGGLLLWVEDYNYAVLAFTITGSLLAFLRYNLSAWPRKINMGDAGALLLGMTVTILAIRFIESPVAQVRLSIVSPMGLIFGILFIPVFYTIRLLIRKISRRETGFFQKETTIHREIIPTGLSPRKTSLLFYLGNVALIVNVLFFKNQTALVIIILSLVIGSVFVHLLIMWRHHGNTHEVHALKEKINIIKEENSLI